MTITTMKSIGEIREITSQILEDSGYMGVFPVPIDEIIKKQNFTLKGIGAKDAPRHFSGLVNHKKKWVIINNSHCDGRKRFTAAHELGHIILHPDQDNIDYRINFSNSNTKETEANRFAAEILMPYEDFLICYRKNDADLSYVANYFGVSVGAATIRAEVLGLV